MWEDLTWWQLNEWAGERGVRSKVSRMLIFAQEPRRDDSGHARSARLTDVIGNRNQVSFDLFEASERKQVGALSKEQKSEFNAICL